MLSKTMPFRAKEVDQLLKQARERLLPSPTLLWCVRSPSSVVGGQRALHLQAGREVEERLRRSARSRLQPYSARSREAPHHPTGEQIRTHPLHPPVADLSSPQVKEHPWCADAIAKCAASMPKEDVKDTKGKKVQPCHTCSRDSSLSSLQRAHLHLSPSNRIRALDSH